MQHPAFSSLVTLFEKGCEAYERGFSLMFRADLQDQKTTFAVTNPYMYS
jgi:hypothetical protein